MAANPLSSAAGYFTLAEIERQGACERAGVLGDRFTAGLRASIQRCGLPFVAYNQGSIVHLQTVGHHALHVDFNRFWEIPAMMKEIEGPQARHGGDGRGVHRRGRHHPGRLADVHQRRAHRSHDRPGGRARSTACWPRSRAPEAAARGPPVNEEARPARRPRRRGPSPARRGAGRAHLGEPQRPRWTTDSIAITPSGIPYGTSPTTMIVRMDPAPTHGPGRYRPSGERKVHLEIYRRRPEVWRACTPTRWPRRSAPRPAGRADPVRRRPVRRLCAAGHEAASPRGL